MGEGSEKADVLWFPLQIKSLHGGTPDTSKDRLLGEKVTAESSAMVKDLWSNWSLGMLKHENPGKSYRSTLPSGQGSVLGKRQ